MSFTDVIIVDRDTGFEMGRIYYDSLTNQLVINAQEGMLLKSRAGYDIQLDPSNAVNFTNYQFPIDDGQFRQVLTTDGAGQLSFVSLAAAMNINLDDLVDVVITTPANGDILTYSNGDWVNTQVQITTSFIELTDTPADYTGNANKIVTVNAGEDGLEFTDPVQNAPVDSVFGRTGIVVAASGDYDSDEVTNTSTVTGVNVSDALESLDSDINGIDLTVKADKIVPAVTGDFAALSISGNLVDSGVSSADFATAAQGTTADSATQPGDNVSTLTNDALYTSEGDNVSVFVNDAGYLTSVTAAPVDSVFGRTGVIVALSTDYDSFYANLAQGALADTSLQPLDNISELTNDSGYLTSAAQSGDNVSIFVNDAGYITSQADISGKADKIIPSVVGNFAGLDAGGNLIDTNKTAAQFATAAQGTLADSASQVGDNVSDFVNDAGYITSVVAAPVDTVHGRIGDVVAESGDYAAFYATTAQGTLADSALQDITAESIGDLSDVDLTGAVHGKILQFDFTFGGFIVADIPAAPVDSVAGKTGVVVLDKADITDFSDGDYATASQGLLADSATQPGDNVSTLTNDAGYVTSVSIDGKADKIIPSVTGNFAGLDATGNLVDTIYNGSSFATPAQGTLADSALQVGDNVSDLVNDAGYITSVTAAPVDSVHGRIGDVVADSADYAAFYATTAQGTLADSALQTGDNISELANDSGYVTAASAPITTVHGRTGDVVGAEGDYDIDQLGDVDTTGLTASQILEWDGLKWSPINTPSGAVTTVFGRTGDVVATVDDYTTDLVGNDSGVSGTTLTQALNDLSTNKIDLAFGDAGNFAAMDPSGQLSDSNVGASSFATAAQGITADSATQPGDNVSTLANDAGYLTDISAENIGDLNDVITAGILTDQILKWNGVNFVAADDIDTVLTSILQLQDTPSSYVGQAAKSLIINNGEDNVVFEDRMATLDDDTRWPEDNGTNGYVLSTDGTTFSWSQVVNPSSTFVGLTDTPPNYTGAANKVVLVDPVESGLEYRTVLPVPVESVFGREGIIIAELGDYGTSLITNLSLVPGDTDTAALNWLNDNKLDTNSVLDGGAF